VTDGQTERHIHRKEDIRTAELSDFIYIRIYENKR
jgi:hypothetical protein